MASPVKALQLPWLARVAEVTWLAAGVLIPLAFDVRANQAFELPKLIVLTILAVLALTATSLGLLSLRSWEVRANVATLALVWLALVATASIRSGNIVESIWGSYERQSGLILAVALVGLGAGPWMYLRTEAQLRRLAWAIVLGSLPPLLYGLVQRAGLDWIGWIGRPLGVTSTLGSSTALGGYVALSAALTLAVVVSLSAADDRRPASLMRPLAISILLVQLAVLLLTSVRAALAGYVIGLSVTFLVATGRATRPGRRNVALITAALVLITGGIIV
ncbi:MAG TPA: hypothetical protein VHX16_13725, partial [Chloroflexota bacterium]|nr:hypothetical protein [Chloroflexota bacterium]